MNRIQYAKCQIALSSNHLKFVNSQWQLSLKHIILYNLIFTTILIQYFHIFVEYHFNDHISLNTKINHTEFNLLGNSINNYQ